MKNWMVLIVDMLTPSLLFVLCAVANLTLVTSDPCSPAGKSINATSGHISSPNFPNNYDKNRICTWNITVPGGKTIKLTFLNFTLVAGENDDCAGAAAKSARVFITNVASHGGKPNDFKICGQKLPPPVYSEGHFIQVRFESRTGVVNQGFNAIFQAIDGDSLCPTDMILNETSGSFSSPYNPRNYPFNQTCSWKIIGRQGYRVELTIPDYNLQRCDGATCSCDYMEVQSSFSDQALPGKLCGSARFVPVKFYSLHESLRVLFVSDDTNMDYDGFGATYKLLNYSPPICPKEAIPLSGSGKISSTNYPKSNYTASRNCTWNITAPADKIVNFTLTDFVLSECSADRCSDSCSYVELYDGGSTSSPSLGRFCQGSSWNEPQLSNGNQMFVMFHPGQTVDRGFEAKYESTATDDKSENVQLMSSAVDNKACTQEVISFNCSANANPRVTSYQLFENQKAILNTSASGTWRKTLKSEGVFVYKCVANNSLGSEYSMDLSVTVNVPSSVVQITQDQNVTEGDNFTLTCNASGMPQPNVSWIKPGGQRQYGHMLEFTNINRSQAGEYKCEASNECGNGTETATIHVLYTPRITNISGEQIVNNGEVVSLFCMAEGNPAPKITWTKVADNSQVNFPLTIRGSQDEGMYRCTAENGVGSPVTKFVNMTVHFPAAVVAMDNHTVVKNGTIELYCNVSGTPPPTVLWTRVKSGETWNQKKWTISDIQVEELGEYRCNASNKYGGDIKSTFILYEGGFCEKQCTDGKLCLKFGATYVCICPERKTGEKCEKTDTPKKDFDVGLKLKGEFKQEYENLENPETKRLVKNIEENVMEEFKGTGLASVKVLKLRQGSIIADLKLTFNDSVGESSVNALLTQAANKGKIGDMEVEEISVGKTFPEPTTTSVPPEDCGTFFEGEDCKKAKPGLIVLCVIGGVAVLAIIVAIIAYGLHKKKSNVASFSNGNYTPRAAPDGTAGSEERTLQGNNYGNVNSGYEYDKTNGQNHSTEMVTFKGTNPAQTPGIAINDSSMTKKAQPGEGMYADLGEFYQKAPAPPTTPVKMPPEYEKTEYAEISQFLRGPVKTDEEKEDESNNDGNSSPDKDSSPDKGEDPSPDMGDAGDRNSNGPVEFLVDI